MRVIKGAIIMTCFCNLFIKRMKPAKCQPIQAIVACLLQLWVINGISRWPNKIMFFNYNGSGGYSLAPAEINLILHLV